jgi:DNA recombination protein RmuC
MFNEYALPGWVLMLWLMSTSLLLISLVALLVRQRQRIALKDLDLQARTTELQISLEHATAHFTKAEDARVRLSTELDRARDQNFDLRAQLITAQAVAEQKESNLKSEIDNLRSAKDAMTREFENLANRLFDAKQEHFSRATQTQLHQIIAPFRDQLRDFRSKVEEVQQQDSARHHQLMGQIVELQKQSQQIGMDAVNLTNALKGSNKVMGDWGEMILANLLEQMGFQKSRDYDLQVSHAGEEGRRLQPDVIVYLPDEKDLIIDAKVSLLAYERYCSSGDETLKSQALKEHIDSIRAHVRSLGGKKYSDFVGRKRLDFVCMFIPIEAAFVSAVQHAPELLQEAYNKQIIVVSPASLFVILRTVSALWQRDRQDKNVEQIVVSAGKLHDQFVRFLESMQDIGVGIERASRSFKTAMSRLESGNGNLIKRSDDLRRLGAKTTRIIPRDLAEQSSVNTETLEEFDE